MKTDIYVSILRMNIHVELFGTFKHTIGRFRGYTATVGDVLLTET